jgi:hypothetical protein
MHGGGWLMAIDEKRQLGTSITNLGMHLFFDTGKVVVPEQKVLRALGDLQRTSVGDIGFGDYRSMMGLLEHLVVFNACKRDIFYGMYRPFLNGGGGPTDPVPTTQLLLKHVQRWQHLLSNTAGCDFFHSLPDSIPVSPSLRTFHLFSDAALLGARIPGLGGWFHGMWWSLPIPMAMVRVPIAHLEFLAAAISLMVFEHYVLPSPEVHTSLEVHLHIDGSASPQVLSGCSARSTMMQIMHDMLCDLEPYKIMEDRLWSRHTWGETNPLADAASRGNYEALIRLARRIDVTPRRVVVPHHAEAFLQAVFQRGLDEGEYVDASSDGGIPEWRHAIYEQAKKRAREGQ